MSFPRYPKYKPSGVEWLGDVPEHWHVKPVKNLATIVNGYPFDSKLFDGADGYPLVRIRDLNMVEAESHYKGEFVESAAITSDDVLIGMDGDFNVGRWLGQGRALLNQRMCCVRGRSSVLTRLLEYSLPIPLKAINAVTYATTVKHLASSQVEKTLVAIPPDSDEQSQLAGFLDRETSKIDGLVGEQRRLIELLKEKRQAVISHAVTKGLNPQAPLKPSGIQWLGDVPEHWEIRKLSHLFRAGKGKNGQLLTKEYCAEHDGEYPVYSGQTENEGVMATWDQYEFDFGEEGVLFSTTVGAKAMHLKQLFGKFSLSQNCMIIWPTSPFCHASFFYYHFQPLFHYERGLIPDHMQASFRIEDLYGYQIAVPPEDEQLAIRRALDAETAKLDALTAEAERAIELLQERRTALISAAVTGKIDVREFSRRAAENAEKTS